MESPAVRFSFRVRRPQNGLGRHRASMPNACADWTRAASLENIDAEDDGDILEPVDRCNRHKAKVSMAECSCLYLEHTELVFSARVLFRDREGDELYFSFR